MYAVHYDFHVLPVDHPNVGLLRQTYDVTVSVLFGSKYPVVQGLCCGCWSNVCIAQGVGHLALYLQCVREDR